ncbi:hypothetical protein BACCELL_03430 [Bacteroides cellulosilyticus DSM 14838]|uniref:Uncharacterized protein n=1 Tax=Bacteroides cellulosilyticus DSM 14838 TaxID=537012 RepID=E2NGK5_9BACE|nr:hypothetical protein BACCELL_03430 [Bacteroides cellulosilyticus DSM 14838]
MKEGNHILHKPIFKRRSQRFPSFLYSADSMKTGRLFLYTNKVHAYIHNYLSIH